jgi:hypothetical protein
MRYGGWGGWGCGCVSVSVASDDAMVLVLVLCDDEEDRSWYGISASARKMSV